MSSLRFAPGASFGRAGTRQAFEAFSDALVAAGLPPITVTSGDRDEAEQWALFYARYVPADQINGRRTYDSAVVNGVRYYRVSTAGKVDLPSLSWHVKGTAGDLGWPYNNTGNPQYARAREIGKKYQITPDVGIAAGEAWHWQFYGNAGVASLGLEIKMDFETFSKFLTRALRYNTREFGDGAADAAQGPTLWEKFAEVLTRLTGLDVRDETDKGGWFPFRNALSRWLTYHSRADGPDGAGRTLHEALDQIEAAVKEQGTVTVKIDPADMVAALKDPVLVQAISAGVADEIDRRQRERLA
jgi:hypothetical protein